MKLLSLIGFIMCFLVSKSSCLFANCTKFGLFLCLSIFFCSANAQSNMLLTNPLAEQLLLGNYDPNDYLPSTILSSQEDIACGIQDEISADSLHSYLSKLETFQTRHVYSDTVSSTTGIGAARRWVHAMFEQFSIENENRLITSYLQFDTAGFCGFGQFRNIFTVLPGSDTADKSIILFEAHIDSRCQASCDITCFAPGIEDNGSGTALVIELARTMSKYSFRHTLVFMITVGEELGLYGAHAFSKYVKYNGIEIKAVQNNDVIGGVICGFTSSPPSCPFEGHIDSTHVRIFSQPGTTSGGYARLVQLTYQEKLLPIVDVPMTVRVMNQEDRTGRGGDHQPFRQLGYTAIRFTAQNEHGDGTGTPPDRTHTADDVVGVDTDADGVIDSFFVDFNYLKRNAVINAVVAKIADVGPETPDFQMVNDANGVTVQITSQTQYQEYRVHARDVTTTSWIDTLVIYGFSDTLFYTIPGINSGNAYFVSVASVDSNGITSPFSTETIIVPVANTASAPVDPLPYFITCPTVGMAESPHTSIPDITMRCVPNPSSGIGRIIVEINKDFEYEEAQIVIRDIVGKVIFKKPISLHVMPSELAFDVRDYAPGIYLYSLVVDEKVLVSEKLSLVK